MKKTALAAAVCVALSAAGTANANQSIEQRFAEMETRIQQLENRIQDQGDVILAKEKQINDIKNSVQKQSDSRSGGWWQSVEIGGVIEVEAGHLSTKGSDNNSDLITPTVEVAITAQVNDWVSAEIVALYEEDTDNDGDLNIDTALISIANPDDQWFVNAGQFTLPFGAYNTNMLSDPITLDLGETGDTAIEAGYGANGFSASIYTFQGDHSDDIDNFGAALNFETATEQMEFFAHIGYINNLGESDGIVDGGWVATTDNMAGWTASAQINVANFTLIGEYLTAADEFSDSNNEKPSAFNIEVGYNFEAGDLPVLVAVGYQGTNDAEHSNWNLPESRILGALTIEIMEGTSLGLEYKNEESYGGADTDTLTGKLAVEF